MVDTTTTQPTVQPTGTTTTQNKPTVQPTTVPTQVPVNHLAQNPLYTSFVHQPQYQSFAPQYVAPNAQMRQSIRGETRLEQVPYERSYTDYEAVQRTEYVPVQRTYTDYYTVEHQTEYVPQPRYETRVEYVPQQRLEEVYDYVPVERQVVTAQSTVPMPQVEYPVAQHQALVQPQVWGGYSQQLPLQASYLPQRPLTQAPQQQAQQRFTYEEVQERLNKQN